MEWGENEMKRKEEKEARRASEEDSSAPGRGSLSPPPHVRRATRHNSSCLSCLLSASPFVNATTKLRGSTFFVSQSDCFCFGWTSNFHTPMITSVIIKGHAISLARFLLLDPQLFTCSCPSHLHPLSTMSTEDSISPINVAIVGFGMSAQGKDIVSFIGLFPASTRCADRVVILSFFWVLRN